MPLSLCLSHVSWKRLQQTPVMRQQYQLVPFFFTNGWMRSTYVLGISSGPNIIFIVFV